MNYKSFLVFVLGFILTGCYHLSQEQERSNSFGHDAYLPSGTLCHWEDDQQLTPYGQMLKDRLDEN